MRAKRTTILSVWLDVGRGGPRVHPKIVDDGGNELPRCEVGRLIISGGGVGAGYYKDPEKTKQAFG